MTLYNAKTDSKDLHVPRFTQYGTNLSDAQLGSRVIFATDEFFAVADNLLLRAEPQYDPNTYCAQGKVMDGWESRRRRLPGHDWCVIRLAYRGTIAGVELDTAFFTGNFTPAVSIQAADLSCYGTDMHDEWMPGSFDRFERGGGIRGSKSSLELCAKAESACANIGGDWKEILPLSKLNPGYAESRMHYFSISEALKRTSFTHIRLNYFPDGGVARLKVYGSVSVLFEKDYFSKYTEADMPIVDLASMGLGGRGLACSNKHFGVPRNLLKPGRGVDMGDGWETARHLDRPSIIKTDPNTGLVDTDLGDWCILQLGSITSLVEEIEIGNFPESVMIEAGSATNNTMDLIHDEKEDSDDVKFDDLTIRWFPLLIRTKLGPDKVFHYRLSENELVKPPRGDDGVSYISHIRVNIYPDGGISRIRVRGKPMRPSRGMKRVLSSL